MNLVDHPRCTAAALVPYKLLDGRYILKVIRAYVANNSSLIYRLIAPLVYVCLYENVVHIRFRV